MPAIEKENRVHHFCVGDLLQAKGPKQPVMNSATYANFLLLKEQI
jgi:hypothetical protein